MKINFLQELPARPDIQLFITTLYEDERPPRGLTGLLDWHLNGRVSKFILDGLLTGSFGEKLLFNGSSRLPWTRYMVIGMGRRSDLNQENYKTISGVVVSSIVDMNFNSVCCQLPGFHHLNFELSRAFELFLAEIERHSHNITDLNIVWIEDLIES